MSRSTSEPNCRTGKLCIDCVLLLDAHVESMQLLAGCGCRGLFLQGEGKNCEERFLYRSLTVLCQPETHINTRTSCWAFLFAVKRNIQTYKSIVTVVAKTSIKYTAKKLVAICNITAVSYTGPLNKYLMFTNLHYASEYINRVNN